MTRIALAVALIATLAGCIVVPERGPHWHGGWGEGPHWGR